MHETDCKASPNYQSQPSRAARCFPSGVTSGRAAFVRDLLPLADFGA
ncbi:MAG: hypothetical protein ACT4O2_10485 [Beijerinckiaceae bacterium]